MQQLQNASESQPSTCARAVLEAVLEVMVRVREKMARRHWGGRGGPTIVHFRAMGVLRKRPGANLSMLADQLALTLSATSRLVDFLVAKKLITRNVPEKNRRTISLALTPQGAKLLEKAMHQTQTELALSLKRLSPPQRTQICNAMGLVRKMMEEDAQESGRG